MSHQCNLWPGWPTFCQYYSLLCSFNTSSLKKNAVMTEKIRLEVLVPVNNTNSFFFLFFWSVFCCLPNTDRLFLVQITLQNLGSVHGWNTAEHSGTKVPSILLCLNPIMSRRCFRTPAATERLRRLIKDLFCLPACWTWFDGASLSFPFDWFESTWNFDANGNIKSLLTESAVLQLGSVVFSEYLLY